MKSVQIVIACSLLVFSQAQLAAWPAQSYSPFTESLLAAARTPVNAVPTMQGSAIPSSRLVVAQPVFAASLGFTAPAPIFAAPRPVLTAMPAFAHRRVFATPRLATTPMFVPMAASAPVSMAIAARMVAAPRLVPAFSPFARSAVFIGSNKGKNITV